ncbi:MAG TPA: maleylpyruvate isomerase N-terminal domain-containing protein [Actinophytocola sp.]|jgi:hypothetical protein|uniref:maleylpyruvate isomerase N-terminal domain-containing protein n=1 Tax=Actinophytocola sp. TaxID=1872138 RepID=UPI002E0ACF13|nr:maleylpyruvate isomerase N-terminal domain-containing protein [Actinophytocola sp.]
MGGVREDYLAVARAAEGLLEEPAVAAAWGEPSALAEMSVRGLAGHLAYQVLIVRQVLGEPEPVEETITLLEHYGRVRWIGAPLDDEFNVGVRRGGEAEAADGPGGLAARVGAAVGELAGRLESEPERAVRIPLWGAWSLSLNDLLVTRMMELAVHSDDLAVSVGVATPELPESAVERVVDLLSRIAVRRHGATAVLRALSRAERAPATIAAF